MKQVESILKNHNSFALFCHVNPDADALGSMNALKLVLKKMNKKVYSFCDGKVPKNLQFLDIELDDNIKVLSKVEVFIMLDCNGLDRIGKYGEYFDKGSFKINIDHHQKGNYVFDYSCVDTDSPSTCDIVYEIIKGMDVTINSKIAENLYAGLSSDTGGFIHSNTKIISHRHAYELINYNFDLTNANYNMFKYKPKNYLYFYKTALNNTKSYLDEKVFVTFFSFRHYKKFEDICDNSASFQFLDGIEGNEIRVRITEKKRGEYNISFRSNIYADVCNIAKKFNGGGHKNASGATVNTNNFKELLSSLIETCREELSKDKEN